jgi:hypothetical protein
MINARNEHVTELSHAGRERRHLGSARQDAMLGP